MIIIYKKSWVNKYFNVNVLSEEGIVFFHNTSTKSRFNSPRLFVGIDIPEITRNYFKPDTFWNISHNFPNNVWIQSDYLSEVLHGIQSNNAPGTKTVIYEPPYFLIFKIQGIPSNYMSFNDYKKNNSESTILSMLLYDEEKSMLKDEYSPELLLPYDKDLCLNELLEFTLYDSQNKLVRVSDKSQLFILLTLLS